MDENFSRRALKIPNFPEHLNKTSEVSFKHFPITCEIFSFTCEHFSITCEHFSTTCENFSTTCAELTITCAKFSTTCEHFSTTCENCSITCEHRMHPKAPHPHVYRVSNDERQGYRNVGRLGWHIDGSYRPKCFKI